MFTVLTVLGTRPEAIKLAPVIGELKRRPEIVSLVCVTGQHRQLLDQALGVFGITPDFDLNLMRPGQTLQEITSNVLLHLDGVLDRVKPDMILVQGDTTTVFAASLSAYYRKIAVGHVEAGLRTYDKFNPFPEEINRRLTTVLTDLHFAPTEKAKAALMAEGVTSAAISVTGNTVIDALLDVVQKPHEFDGELAGLPERVVLITAHRRESFGAPLENICNAIATLARQFPDVAFVYPVHPNPQVRQAIERTSISSFANVRLIQPLEYVAFVHLMKASTLILSDSGGVQEEAPSLNKPVLIVRETTERPELVEAGGGILVGSDIEQITIQSARLLTDRAAYAQMANVPNPFGDGKASQRIVDEIERWNASRS